VSTDGINLDQRLALCPMPPQGDRRLLPRARLRYEAAERDLYGGCVCIGWDERAIRRRDALQQELFGEVAA